MLLLSGTYDGIREYYAPEANLEQSSTQEGETEIHAASLDGYNTSAVSLKRFMKTNIPVLQSQNLNNLGSALSTILIEVVPKGLFGHRAKLLCTIIQPPRAP